MTPKAGEIWFVQLFGSGTLHTFEVSEITKLTTCFMNPLMTYPERPLRYKNSDVEFIEQSPRIEKDLKEILKS